MSGGGCSRSRSMHSNTAIKNLQALHEAGSCLYPSRCAAAGCRPPRRAWAACPFWSCDLPNQLPPRRASSAVHAPEGVEGLSHRSCNGVTNPVRQRSRSDESAAVHRRRAARA
eukprot:scaffold17606_cov225-Isochrysis_galbana.AAC.3